MIGDVHQDCLMVPYIHQRHVLVSRTPTMSHISAVISMASNLLVFLVCRDCAYVRVVCHCGVMILSYGQFAMPLAMVSLL